MDRQTGRQRRTEADKWVERERLMTDGLNDRQKDRWMDRQTETNRGRKRERDG